MLIPRVVFKNMDITDTHPTSTTYSGPINGTSTIAHTSIDDDYLSDSGLSELGAEIEQNLSSATPDGSEQDDDEEHGYDDVMDVESEEDVKPVQENKSRKRTAAKEYYDPELFGLRRSVRIAFALYTGALFEWDETDSSRAEHEPNQIDLSHRCLPSLSNR